MATEQVTQLDAESAALAKAEAARKTNLQDNGGVTVPKGDEKLPPGSRDFANDRKAIFDRANAQRAKQIEASSTNNGEVADYETALAQEQQVRAEAAASGRDPDTAHREFVARGHQPADGTVRPAGTKAPASTDQGGTTTSQNDYATLTFNGRQITVSRRDIDAAGGEGNYLRARELEDREGSLAEQTAQMLQRQQALDAAEESLRRRQAEPVQPATAVGQGAPATVPVSTQGPGASSAASAEDINAEAERLTNLMFSGDPADARKALATVLTEARSNRQTYTADQLAQLAADKLRVQSTVRTDTQPRTEGAKPSVDPRWEKQRQAINAMGAAEFPDVVSDPQAAQRVIARQQQMYADPRNKDRRAIDIAREACEVERQSIQRAKRIEVKQGLPQAPSAGGAAQADEPEKIATGSAYVDMLRDRRNFGIRR